MDQPQSVSAILPPHPTLAGYYGGEQAKAGFVRRIFDASATGYDQLEGIVGLGTGSWYRHRALRLAGLGPGMSVLDVATGTGLVAREAVRIVGFPRKVVGIDPSQGMLARAVETLGIPGVMGVAERLPVVDGQFDLVTMAYAIRHLSDLRPAFREFHRVLKPGGAICLLEFTMPRRGFWSVAGRCYLRGVVPLLSMLMLRGAQARSLWRYTCKTIEGLLPPERITAAIREAGFCQVRHRVEWGIFAQYTARKPAGDMPGR